MNSEPPTVRTRRRLRFNDFDEILNDARRIANAGRVHCLGNWTPGQIFEHLARSFQSSLEPSAAKLPGWLRLIAKMFKPFLLRFGLPKGFQIERTSTVAASEFLPTSNLSPQAGLQLLEDAVAQLRLSEMDAHYNLFGSMSHRDWEMMHCRHAELHFGFLNIDRSKPKRPAS